MGLVPAITFMNHTDTRHADESTPIRMDAASSVISVQSERTVNWIDSAKNAPN